MWKPINIAKILNEKVFFKAIPERLQDRCRAREEDSLEVKKAEIRQGTQFVD
jgi:hypothetical protein